MSLRDKFDLLTEFLGCSLHQDMEFDYASAEAALESQLEGYGIDELKEMHGELTRLLNDPEIPKTTETLDQLGCDVNPVSEDQTPEEWLLRLGHRIEQQILFLHGIEPVDWRQHTPSSKSYWHKK